MKRAYLAGKMRGCDLYNFPAFESAARKLRAAGWEIVSPAEHDLEQGFDPHGPLDDFDMKAALAWDLEQVVHADAVIVLPGWENSVGVAAELAAAEAAGVECLAYIGLGQTEPLYTTLHNDSGEVRVTNEVTGGQKGRKQAQLGAVDPKSLLEVAAVAGFGGDKYERYNFAKGFEWSLSFDAFLRHALAFWGGQDNDEESGLPHMAHAAWHALTLLTFMRHHRGFDDRFPLGHSVSE